MGRKQTREILARHDPISGRPGGNIREQIRNGLGMVWGPKTYTAITNLMLRHNTNYMLSVDEAYVYADNFIGLYEGEAKVGRLVIDAVRNEEGVEFRGHKFNHTIEEFAKGLSNPANFQQGLIFDILLGGGFFSFWGGVKIGGCQIPELVIGRDEQKETCYNSIQAKLDLFAREGYAVAEDTKARLEDAHKKFYETAEEARKLLIEAAQIVAERKP